MRKKVFIGSKIERIEESDKKESFIPIKEFFHIFFVFRRKKNNFIENFFFNPKRRCKRGGLYFKIAVTCFYMCRRESTQRAIHSIFVESTQKNRQ